MKSAIGVVLGIVLILGGLFLAVYVGLYLCFIGGIVDIIEEVKADRAVDAMTIAWAILKIAVAGAVTEIIAIVFVVAGGGMIATSGSSSEEVDKDD